MNIAKSLSSTLNIEPNLLSTTIWKNITSYNEVCEWSIINDFVFSNFKKHPHYKKVLEHVTQEQGQEYLIEIKKTKTINIKCAKNILAKNDMIGNTDIFDYGNEGKYSPTTLRYAKVTSDIIDKFQICKEKLPITIVEIGSGYGGQCLLLDQFINIKSYTLIDTSSALKLAKKYLEQHVTNCKLQFYTINEIDSLEVDILISNYAFSELCRDLQDAYLKKIIYNSRCGYITYNHITDQSFNTYTADEFLNVLPFPAYKNTEKPLTHPNNVIITWER
ncbi:putative sugar O-methyltransferase [Desulfomicrobium sp. ZS1]|uniref:putative sugar O-methyltransferase n=1 Tax=Desulfomicrobium sp. ZS1 TaxID=2952228 RepID=UPI0020B3DBFA|nr:putative sugar O-methyltransferase [Desulfomicrobium sp. ZS1]UTF49340.1 putative sugar O-methyltransferase [Desulfomicrobium sp. ZS1]